MHCREILLTPRCSPRARESPRSCQLFSTTYSCITINYLLTVVDLQGIKVAQFSDFGLFSLYKTPKMYLLVTSLQRRAYIAEWFRFLHVVVKGPKWCLPEISEKSEEKSGKGNPEKNSRKKIPLDMIKYRHWVQKLLYYTTQHEDGCHIYFWQMYLRGRLRLTTARQLLAYMSSRALAATTT